MSFFVYIIQSKSTKKFYTGMTKDIIKRLKQHNQHLSNTKTTRKNTDYELTYCEIAEDRRSARDLEKFWKSGFGRETRQEMVELLRLGL